MGVLFKNFTSELIFGGPLSDRSGMMLKENDGKLECSSTRHLYGVNAAPCDGEVEKTTKEDKSEKEESNEGGDQGSTEGGSDNTDGQGGSGEGQADANESSGGSGDSGEGNGEGGDDKEKDSDKKSDGKEDEVDATEVTEEEEEEKKEVEQEPEEVDATDASNAPKSQEKVIESNEKTDDDAPVEVKEAAKTVVIEAAEISVSGEKSISLSPGKGKKKVVEEEVNGGDQIAKRTKISE